MPPKITDSNQPDIAEIRAVLALISAAVEKIAADVRELRAEWERYRPLADGYARGGLLGARTAAKVARTAGRVDGRDRD